MRPILVTLLALGICQCSPVANKPTPLVMWHGMGDYGTSYFSMGHIKRLVKKNVPDIYVKSVVVGANFMEDIVHGFIGNVNNQVEQICQEIAADPELQDGYHAVGFSQGAQFLRAVAERCPTPAMKNLISIGGQHQGVFGLPNCDPGNLICEEIRRILDLEAYAEWVQDEIVQAQYWHDPLHEEVHRNKSRFIALINNDQTLMEEQRENLKKLENFVMVKFLNDTMVVPNESSWFGFYRPGQDVEVLPLRETDLYIEDRLGLKEMDEAGKLVFLGVLGNHLDFTDDWFVQEIVEKYIKDSV
ncbi:palmitoyl-protein thioesterase 1-like [Macrobrachium rosenbergii]|uniref:palmitoyl-protein thioesterase 1-like n=1 Tax=Macrobrachium rosenbergii TaxID=79674 RepID=UPI0034D58723